MDNPLTPKKIQNIFSSSKFANRDGNATWAQSSCQSVPNQLGMNYESSEVIDLDNIDDFGESGSNISFTKSRDLSADENSYIKPLPINQTQMLPKHDSTRMEADTSQQSIGSHQIFPRTDSPKYDMSNLYTDESPNSVVNKAVKDLSKVYNADDTLDDVPIRQSKQTTLIEKHQQMPLFQNQANVNDTIAEPPVLQLNNATMMGHTTSNKSGVRSKALTDPMKRYLVTPIFEESNRSEEQDSSLSVSKILNIMRSEPDINVSGMLELIDKQKKERRIKPIKEMHMNSEANKADNQMTNNKVTTLKESKKSETASSASSMNTAIDNSKYKLSEQENVQLASVEEHRVLGMKSPILDCPWTRLRSRSKLPTCYPSHTTNAVTCAPANNWPSNVGSEPAINVSGMLELIDKQKKERRIKPIKEMHMNSEANKADNQMTNNKVTTLKESKKSETASSASSMNTAIDNSKYKLSEQENVQLASVEEHHVLGMKSPILDCPRARLKSRSKLPTCYPSQTTNAVTCAPANNWPSNVGSEPAINVSGMLELIDKQKKERRIKPIKEMHMNSEANKADNQMTNNKVTTLKESKKSETASSASSMNTAIDNSKYKLSEQENVQLASVEEHRVLGMKSPILDCPRARLKSRSKLPTCYPSQTTNAVTCAPANNWPSNVEPEEQVKILVAPVQGLIGGSSTGIFYIQSLSESWLITRFEFNDLPNQGRDLAIDLPKFPIVLTPQKVKKMIIKLASNVELNTVLQFTVLMKNPSADCDVKVNGRLPVEFRMPILQAISTSGTNKLMFPIVGERQTQAKRLLLISECPVDLQLELSILGSNLFFVNNIQEIEKTEGMVKLLDTKPDDRQIKNKPKGMSRTLCRLSNGKALRVSILFSAPTMDSQQVSHVESFTGVLQVKLLGINALLRKVDLAATVGQAKLRFDLQTDRLKLKDKTSISFRNSGTVNGTWFLKFAEPELMAYFTMNLDNIQLAAGDVGQFEIEYVGPDNRLVHGTLIFEEISGNDIVSVKITGGTEKPKTFPIKTHCNSLSWVRLGRKEIRLKNFTEGRVHLKCHISGKGFSLDLPSPSQNLLLTFGPSECRTLYIVFNSKSGTPCTATLRLVYESDTEISRKIMLYGCASGESVTWRGIVTCGDIALIRAVSRAPVLIPLINKANFPSFFATTVQFSLQHSAAAPKSRLVDARRILTARSHHTITLHVDWPCVEKKVACAGAAGNTNLATVTILTGAELTRLRILKILKNSNITAAENPLPELSLEQMAGAFEGDMPELENQLENFNESKGALKELADGLTELKVIIDLTEDFVEDNTIMITDDTVVDYHSFCDL